MFWERALLRVKEGITLAEPLRVLARDRPTLTVWLRYRAALAEGLGTEAAEAYTRLVVTTVERDPRLARTLALGLPDQLARVSPGGRAAYFRVLHQVAATEVTALPLVSRALPELVGQLDDHALSAFVAEGLALFRRSPARAESFLRQESRLGAHAARELQRGVGLTDVSAALTHYARAHCGEDVQIRSGSGLSYTDGHHLYLPDRIDTFGDDRDFLLYRVKTALCAGYLEFGTFDLELERLEGVWPSREVDEGELERFWRAFPNRLLAQELFQVLEDRRVMSRIRTEYPGVGRDVDRLGPSLWGRRDAPTAPAAKVVEALVRCSAGLPPLDLDEAEERALAPFINALPHMDDAAASVHDCARVVREAYAAVAGLMRSAEPGRAPTPDAAARGPAPTLGPSRVGPTGLRPEAARPEDRALEADARRILEQMRAAGEPGEVADARRTARGRNAEDSDYRRMEAMMEHAPQGGAVVPDSGVGDEASRAPGPAQAPDPDADALGRPVRYREWDSGIDDYKPAWVQVFEHRLKPGSRARVDEVLAREHSQIQLLRRRFEALRPQALQRVRGLTDGSDLDLERAIEEEVAARVGQERSDRIYARDERARRDVAVAFLLDMSSSTNESADGSARRIIDVERDALIVVAEALHALGDPFAIYGFSGYGREHVAFYIAKDFADPYDGACRERVARINFKMENRDGAAIRHCTQKLMQHPARARLLLLLSDGKPLDCGCDHYYDRYAQEDTRAALAEARRLGVHPFCVTVDPSGGQYLARMYGDVAYAVIDRVDKLPGRLLKIYKKLAL